MEAARWELAAELTEDLRGVDARIRETRKKAAAAVAAAGTSLTGLFGVGPVIAATVIGDVRHVSRFGNRDRFAAYNGTAPIEVSSGGRKVYRLSRRGNRRHGHAIHMAAVTQIRYRHTKGRACYDKKLAEGKTPKEALRALKRQISDAIFACLQEDARRAAAAAAKSPGGQPGNHSASRAAGSHPDHRLFGQATPGPATHPTTLTAPFPAPPPSRASEQPGPGPGAARPRRANQGVLDAAAREPIMPRSGKGRSRQAHGSSPPKPLPHPHQRFPLDLETKRCSIWAVTWIARVTVVSAPERLSGSRPGGKQALAGLTSLRLAGQACIAAARRFHAAAQIARCERS